MLRESENSLILIMCGKGIKKREMESSFSLFLFGYIWSLGLVNVVEYPAANKKIMERM